MFRTVFALLFAASMAQAASVREIAEWIIRWEGQFTVEGSRQPIGRLSEIPEGEFQIVGVDLTGAVMPPDELAMLSSLTSLARVVPSGPDLESGRRPRRLQRRIPGARQPHQPGKDRLRLAFRRADQYQRRRLRAPARPDGVEGYSLRAVPPDRYQPCAFDQAPQPRPELQPVQRYGHGGTGRNEASAAADSSRHDGDRRGAEADQPD